MIEFFSDVITAVRLTREIRRAKNLPVRAYPRVSGASWLDTIESGVFRSSIELEKAVRKVLEREIESIAAEGLSRRYADDFAVVYSTCKEKKNQKG